MNERIKELALQSKLLVEKTYSPGMEEFANIVAKAVDVKMAHYYNTMGGKAEPQEVLMQQFAELIVKECAKIAKKEQEYNARFSDADKHPQVNIDQCILMQFGL